MARQFLAEQLAFARVAVDFTDNVQRGGAVRDADVKSFKFEVMHAVDSVRFVGKVALLAHAFDVSDVEEGLEPHRRMLATFWGLHCFRVALQLWVVPVQLCVFVTEFVPRKLDPFVLPQHAWTTEDPRHDAIPREARRVLEQKSYKELSFTSEHR